MPAISVCNATFWTVQVFICTKVLQKAHASEVQATKRPAVGRFTNHHGFTTGVVVVVVEKAARSVTLWRRASKTWTVGVLRIPQDFLIAYQIWLYLNVRTLLSRVSLCEMSIAFKIKHLFILLFQLPFFTRVFVSEFQKPHNLKSVISACGTKPTMWICMSSTIPELEELRRGNKKP